MRTDEYKQRVEHLARLGRPLQEIEELIDSAPLSSGQKAALWLLAWSYESPRAHRRIVRDALAAVPAIQDPGEAVTVTGHARVSRLEAENNWHRIADGDEARPGTRPSGIPERK